MNYSTLGVLSSLQFETPEAVGLFRHNVLYTKHVEISIHYIFKKHLSHISFERDITVNEE